MRHLIDGYLDWANLLMLAYFFGLSTVGGILIVVGWRAVEDYVRRRPVRDYRGVAESELSLPVTILMPAYNEGPVVVPAVRSLLESAYASLEVVVINDGSNDETFAHLVDAFGLVPVDRVPRSNIESAPIRGVYLSPSEPRLVVIDKDNGGKADALNAGLRYARYPLFCAIDADTMLDPGALARLVWEFQRSPDTVAAGGIVRVINGSRVEDGRIVNVHTPPNLVVNFQILEYLRAFLGARIGWSRLGMLLIISGAFGLFRRDLVVEAGGYDTNTVGEDAELVIRLHRLCREQGRPARITFFPDPICWTEAPASLRQLARQRDRWQRGLMEVLWKHRGMLFRRKYGRIGMVAMPYFLIFEAMGPAIELIGIVALITAIATGAISPVITLLLFTLSITTGLVLSFTAILMEERAFRRYPSWKCLRRLVVAALVENFGYRQLNTFIRARAWLTVRKKGTWGEMTRAGFETLPAPMSAPAAVSPQHAA